MVCPIFDWFVSGLAGLWMVCGWFGWFVGSLWVVWLVCRWFRVLQLTQNLNVETEGKISLLVTFIKQFATQSKLSLIFTKKLLFPQETAYLSSHSHDAFKSADGNSVLF